jgi:multiple sugar transport system permease protein
MRKALTYILSLPALLMCIEHSHSLFHCGLLFDAAVPAESPQMKGFIWFGNYVNFFYDPKFWNTVYISLLYVPDRGPRTHARSCSSLLLQKQTRFNNIASILRRFPDDAPHWRLSCKLMTNPNFGILSYFVGLMGSMISGGRPTLRRRCSRSSSLISGSIRLSS